jgi:hypothetical protein
LSFEEIRKKPKYSRENYKSVGESVELERPTCKGRHGRELHQMLFVLCGMNANNVGESETGLKGKNK